MTHSVKSGGRVSIALGQSQHRLGVRNRALEADYYARRLEESRVRAPSKKELRDQVQRARDAAILADLRAGMTVAAVCAKHRSSRNKVDAIRAEITG